MRDLDDSATYHLDSRLLGTDLKNLPGWYERLGETYPSPHTVEGYGEGWWAAALAHDWMPASIPISGTHFVLQGGFPLERGAAAALLEQVFEGRLVRFGQSEEVDLTITPHPLSTYRYLMSLLWATGRSDEAARVERATLAALQELHIDQPTDKNPAKQLAWRFVERTPIWVVSESYTQLAAAAQQLFARIAGSLSVAPPPGALEFYATALEARHEQGDPLIAVIVGEDAYTRLATEVLASRVDAVVHMPASSGEGVLAETLVHWYELAWSAYYLSLLYDRDPVDAEMLTRLRENL